MRRDEFLQTTKDTIARRAGYVCSNPTCRRGTSRPDPADPGNSINLGVAAHITAASPGGARYDDMLSRAERKAAENGIWLCQTCSHLIDQSEEAWSKNTLKLWKAWAETAATTNSRATSEAIEECIRTVDEVVSKLNELLASVSVYRPAWWESTPGYSEMTEDEKNAVFHKYGEEERAVYWENRLRFEINVLPMLRDVMGRSQLVLGMENEAVRDLRNLEIMDWSIVPTNRFTIIECTGKLADLKLALQLR